MKSDTILDQTDWGPLFDPRGVALIGASSNPERAASRPLRHLRAAGYQGAIHIVNPGANLIEGIRTVATMADIEGPCDMAVILRPIAEVPSALEQCANAGCRFAVVIAAPDPDEEELVRSIRELARASGIRVIGPNSNGVAGSPRSFALSLAPALGQPPMDAAQGLAMIGQSGGTVSAAYSQAYGAGVPLALYADTGNQAETIWEELLAYAIERSTVSAVGVMAETVTDHHQLVRAGRRARSLGKPVGLLLAGQSEEGASIAQSHTGAIVSQSAHQAVVLESLGIDLCADIPQLWQVPTLRAFLGAECPPPRSLAILTTSGGIAALAADASAASGLEVPPLPPKVLTEVRQAAPEAIGMNPIDVGGQVLDDPARWRRVLEILAGWSGPEVVLVNLTWTGLEETLVRETLAVAVETGLRIVVVWHSHPRTDLPGYRLLVESGLPLFSSVSDAASALARISQTENAVATSAASPSVTTHVRGDDDGPSWPGAGIASIVMNEYEGKKVLRSAGIDVPPGDVVCDLAEAKELAERLGYPVVAKVVACGILHKSRIGGVVPGIRDPEGLASALRAIYSAATEAGVETSAYLIERHIEDSRPLELLLSIRTDPRWGAVAVLGLGGQLAEWGEPLAMLPLPLDTDAVIERLALATARMGLNGDSVRKLSACVIGLADWYWRHRAFLYEVEINPLVQMNTGDFIALDVVISCVPKALEHLQADATPLARPSL